MDSQYGRDTLDRLYLSYWVIATVHARAASKQANYGSHPAAPTTATDTVLGTEIAQARESNQKTHLNRPRCAVIGFVGFLGCYT